MKKLLLTGSFILFGSLAHAVDGYKNFKFEMSPIEVQKLANIELTRTDQGNGIILYQGENFPFAVENVDIAFFFIENKLLRIGFEIPIDKALPTIEALTEKYGKPFSQSDQATFEAVDNIPNSEAFMGFDKDTIFVKIMSDEKNKQTSIVIYTSPKYEQLMLKNQKEKIKDDL